MSDKPTDDEGQELPDQRVINREIEDRWRRGEITFEAFDWWLRSMCGV